MSAETFAIIGALSFAFGNVVTRRAVIKVFDTVVGLLISLPVGLLFFTLVLIAAGQVGSIINFSWQGYLWLSAAGILNFVVGRWLFYNCVKLAGANTATVMTRVGPLIAVSLGISVLGEPVTWKLIAGVLLIIFGVMLAGLNPQMFRSGQGLFTGISRKALLLGTSAGLAWGLTPIMVKLGLSGSSSPIAGVFISYLAANVALITFLSNHNRRDALLDTKLGVIGLFSLASLFSSTAQLMRYVALHMAPVSVVAPLFATSPVLLLIPSFLLNRKLEVFSRFIIIGAIAVVLGTILVL